MKERKPFRLVQPPMTISPSLLFLPLLFLPATCVTFNARHRIGIAEDRLQLERERDLRGVELDKMLSIQASKLMQDEDQGHLQSSDIMSRQALESHVAAPVGVVAAANLNNENQGKQMVIGTGYRFQQEGSGANRTLDKSGVTNHRLSARNSRNGLDLEFDQMISAEELANDALKDEQYSDETGGKIVKKALENISSLDESLLETEREMETGHESSSTKDEFEELGRAPTAEVPQFLKSRTRNNKVTEEQVDKLLQKAKADKKKALENLRAQEDLSVQLLNQHSDLEAGKEETEIREDLKEALASIEKDSKKAGKIPMAKRNINGRRPSDKSGSKGVGTGERSQQENEEDTKKNGETEDLETDNPNNQNDEEEENQSTDENHDDKDADVHEDDTQQEIQKSDGKDPTGKDPPADAEEDSHPEHHKSSRFESKLEKLTATLEEDIKLRAEQTHELEAFIQNQTEKAIAIENEYREDIKKDLEQLLSNSKTQASGLGSVGRDEGENADGTGLTDAEPNSSEMKHPDTELPSEDLDGKDEDTKVEDGDTKVEDGDTKIEDGDKKVEDGESNVEKYLSKENNSKHHRTNKSSEATKTEEKAEATNSEEKEDLQEPQSNSSRSVDDAERGNETREDKNSESSMETESTDTGELETTKQEVKDDESIEGTEYGPDTLHGLETDLSSLLTDIGENDVDKVPRFRKAGNLGKKSFDKNDERRKRGHGQKSTRNSAEIKEELDVALKELAPYFGGETEAPSNSSTKKPSVHRSAYPVERIRTHHNGKFSARAIHKLEVSTMDHASTKKRQNHQGSMRKLGHGQSHKSVSEMVKPTVVKKLHHRISVKEENLVKPKVVKKGQTRKRHHKNST